jgi:hypothetical protein
MAESTPSFSCRYVLSLAEAQDGFALASFGKQSLSQYLTPILSVAIIVWGLYLGVSGIGKMYVILGAVFLLLQLLLRQVFLPRLFARQFKRYRFAQIEQGIDLYQHHMVLYSQGQAQQLPYSDIGRFAEGKQAYMLQLKNKTVIVLSKQAVAQTGQSQFFTSVFQAYR